MYLVTTRTKIFAENVCPSYEIVLGYSRMKLSIFVDVYSCLSKKVAILGYNNIRSSLKWHLKYKFSRIFQSFRYRLFSAKTMFFDCKLGGEKIIMALFRRLVVAVLAAVARI